MKTFSAKPHEVQHDWILVDAADQVLGRLAAQIASRLRGKHKPEYTPHVDTGDYVIVLNADKVRFTGGEMVHKDYDHYTTKMAKKSYVWFTGWPSGQRTIKALDLWSKKPNEILHLAVKRMLPKNALARHMLDKLKLVTGTSHPYQAQQPVPFPEHLLPK